MLLDREACHTALRSRDARFDGIFFTGVKSTGVYCRPVCPAKTPKYENCVFFQTAAAAEAAGFRPCLRCRPESSPIADPLGEKRLTAEQVLRRIHFDGLFGESLESLASQFRLSSRQLRRIVKDEYGVSPARLLRTHRLLFARKLLRETAMPITDVAFSSGFSSLARFNAAFRTEYDLAPRDLRREARPETPPRGVQLLLAYRAPLDWPRLLGYLAPRLLPGVESIEEGTYRRTVRPVEYCVFSTIPPVLRIRVARGEINVPLPPSE